jgi:hypothetical protein
MAEIIPAEHRYPQLNIKLDLFVSAIFAVVSKVPGFDKHEENLFTALLRPWLLAAGVDPSVRQASEPAKETAEKAGFPAEKLAADIREIFDNDQHLRECCGEPLALAYALDGLYVWPAVVMLLEGQSDRIPDLYANFTRIVYEQGPYTRIAYSHLFNFSSSLDEIDLSPLVIRRLKAEDIGSILGGPSSPTQLAWLQPPQVGMFFIVQEETGAVENLFEWLWDSHYKAVDLFRVVQYHQNGVAYVDYSSLHFKPAWVNHLRKFGLLYVGNPRRLPYLNGSRPLELSDEDLPAIRRKLKTYVSPKILELMKDETVPFRQGSLRAGDYYEASLAEERAPARLVALAIALEALFSPDDKQDISFKTALAASHLLGTSPTHRGQIFSDLQDLYRRRSKIVHGSYDVKKVYEGSFVTHDDVDRWSPYIRESIMRFLTMYFRGKKSGKDLETLRKNLLACALDNNRAAAIREQSDLEKFLDEFELDTTE